MEKDRLVSIIVPIYNVEIYLKRCIQSLVNQSYSHIEIILVNDGSTDRCEDICLAYKQLDNRIKYVKKKNGGLSSARNKGIDSSKGDYLVFVDSDDYIDEKMIEKLLYFALKEDADIVECSYYEVLNNAEKKIVSSKKIFTKEEAIESLIENTAITPIAWNKIYTRRLFNQIRYKENIYHEDEEIIIKLLSASNRIVKISDCLYFYVIRSGSIINSKLNVAHFDIIPIMKNRITFLQKINCSEKLINLSKARLSNIYNELYARIYLSNNNGFDEQLKSIKKERSEQIKDVLKSNINYKRKIKCLMFYLFPTISYKIKMKLF